MHKDDLKKQEKLNSEIMTLGINSFSARYIAIHYHNKEYDKANEYFEKMKMKIPKQIIDTHHPQIRPI